MKWGCSLEIVYTDGELDGQMPKKKTCNCLPIFCFSCLPLVISTRAPASLARAKKNKKRQL